METNYGGNMHRQSNPATIARGPLIATLIAFIGLSGPAHAVDYFDDFARPNGAALGDGWIEKAPGAFSIASGAAAKNAVGTGYRDNIAYRPAVEDLLDAEASVELQLLNASVGYPQVFVRVQGNTAAQNDVLDAYILYVANNASTVILGRQRGNQFVTTLATINLATPLNTTNRFRLRLRAVGTTPVNVDAWIERQNGAAWDVIGQASVADAAANRITTPGAVGFGGFIESSYVYDNFNRVDLEGGGGPPPDNPVPATTGLVPDNVDEGVAAFSLTVQGTDFVPGAIVRWNGSDRATTYVSATELQAAMGAADVAVAGSASVTVFNPAPGGGVSNAQTFTINALPGNPVPAVAALTPDTAEAGGSAFTLTVDGSGFIPESVIRWEGADRQTTFVSATRLQAVIGAADIAAAGNAAVTVFNPGPGGGLSNARTFTVTDPVLNPVPALTSLSPDTITAGSSGFTLAVLGQDFVPDTIVYWNGTPRPTAYVSAGRLDATIDAADISAAGFADVTAVSPAPGGGASNGLQFEIEPAGGPGGGNPQALTSISPVSVAAGANGLQLTLNGSGFTQNSIAQVGGIAVPTTYVTGQQLLADVDSGLLAVDLRSAVTVRTPGADNLVTAPQTLFVLGPGEVVYFDNFNRPDNGDIGNNWTEKVPSVFSLAGGQVSAPETPQLGFNHLITYRPPAEDAQNVEVGMEFVRTPGASSLYPQVHARVQRSTVEQSSSLDSYTLFYDSYFNPGRIHVTPIDDYYECYIASWDVQAPFVEGERYRLRFRVTGTNPVQLTGYMDRLNVDYWEVIGSGSVLHNQNSPPAPGGYCNAGSMIPPITQAGASGFSKWRPAADNYDNFYTITLTGDANPVPVISQLTPNSAQAGSPGLTLTVQGTDFVPGSVVRWNGNARPTTFVSSSEVRATLSSADLASEGTATVRVLNPAPGGGLSNPASFNVVAPVGNPVPSVTGLTPNLVVVNGAGFTLTVLGTNFVPSSVVRWNGENRPTSYVSPTQLQAAIDAADIDTAGSAQVTVSNPAPGGGVSSAMVLTILDPGTDYFDDFARPDSANLGSGWIEKQLGAFSLAGGAVTKNPVSTGYRDNIVYRPAQEDLLDVEASIEFRVLDANVGYPQLLVRVQSNTVANDNVLDGYIVYVNNSPTQAILGRQRGSAFVQPLATLSFTEPLTTADRYRIRLRAVGTNPVVLNAFVERLGPNGWQVIGQANANDGAANRISSPGSVGFGGYVESAYTYDNFTRLYMTP